jgi:NADP-dependent 3-hydroxy acid dehydrogenase YdfG
MGTELDGSRVLVTGGSSGIGAATARAAAAAGARVAVLGRDAERVTAVAREVAGLGVQVDLTDLDAVPAAVDSAVRRLGGLDAVVHAAGMMVPGPVADTDPARWRDMFDVNVVGLLAVTRAALPHLRGSAAPSVVLVSSMSGRRVPRAEGGIYAASKAAVHAVGETLRLELQPQGMRVSTVAPGFVRTPIADRFPAGTVGDFYRSRLAEVGLDPEVIADAIVHVLAQPPDVTVVEYAVVPTAQYRPTHQ